MTSQPGKQTIAIYILPSISKSKNNQTMKSGQLIEYNMRNFFLKNHTQNVVENLVPNPFLKNQNWAYLWISSPKFTQFVYIVCQVEGSRNILKLSCRPLTFTSSKAFLKSKKRSGTSISASFCAWFFKKNFLSLYSIDWPNFIAWLLLFREILGNIWIVIVC